MKSRNYLAIGLGLASAVGVTTLLKDKEKRTKMMHLYEDTKDKMANMWQKEKPQTYSDVVDKAGNPDPYDIPDNKMVDEGAMYGVHYYNENEQQK
ncbi:hypothetical protein [Bacillus testis]|uniref:hypothetical protein n=1 Tax=Bacillus testis TaxID=1622072 RepID=UPI00067F0CB4|nr:hypothetical protein [Bacillus testis]